MLMDAGAAEEAGDSRGAVMARITDNDTTEIFAVASEWCDRCLVQGESLLWPQIQVWTAQNLQRFKTCFIDRPDSSRDRGFEDKFQAQLASETDDVTRLACELLFVYFLFPTSVGAFRKEELIRKVAGWEGC